MLMYKYSAYDLMFGKISQHSVAAQCMGQCTGCVCSCRCSCSGGIISDFEWEEI